MKANAALPWTTTPTTLWRKVIAGFALPVLILLIVGFLCFHSVHRFALASESVSRSHEVLTNLEGISSALKDIEIGTRGFIVTGDNDYLKTYRNAQESLTTHLNSVVRLTAENTNQQKSLEVLKPQVEQFLLLTWRTIAERKEGNREKALVIIETGRSKVALDRVGNIIAAIQAEERRLLDQNKQTAQRSGFTTQGIIVLALLCSLGIAILAGIAIYDDIAARKRAEVEREALIQKLSAALATVKTLSGLLPICAWCKNIRDDKGYWKQLEEYLSDHSDAEFTHGICPNCVEKQQADHDQLPAPKIFAGE